MNKEFDILIIGGGPAGASAGIYVQRAGVKSAIFNHGQSALSQAKTISNYYGFNNISGRELLDKGLNQYLGLGGSVFNEQVVRITKDYQTENIIVKTASQEFETKAIIICTGAGVKKIIPELEDYKDKNVSYCAICDGFFYKDRPVCVIGDDQFAVNECLELEGIASKVYMLTNGVDIDAFSGVQVITSKIREVNGLNRVEEIEFENDKKINVDGVFVALGSLSSTEIAKQLGLLTANNCIKVDKNFSTNVAGVFAGGDVIGGLLQVSKAVSDGAQAGLEAVKYVKIMELNKK